MSGPRARLRALLAGDADSGVTLVELLVTVTLLALVMGAVASSVLVIGRATGNANATLNDLGRTRVTMDRLTQLVRAAVGPDGDLVAPTYAFEVAAPNELLFYSNVGVARGEGPQRVHIYVASTNDLVEDVWPAQGAGPFTWPGPPRSRVLVHGLAETAALFRFLTFADPNNANSVCGAQLVQPIANADPLLDRRDEIDALEINLSVRDPDSNYTNVPVRLQGFVSLANSSRSRRFDPPSGNPTSTCLDG